MPPRAPDIVLPELQDEHRIAHLLWAAQRLLLKHPAAAQAAYRSLVAEGRAFAATAEGRAWRSRLEASSAIRRGRSLWEAATMNVLDATEPDTLPGPLIDLVAQALSCTDLELWTAQLVEAASAGIHAAGGDEVDRG